MCDSLRITCIIGILIYLNARVEPKGKEANQI